MVVVRAHPDSTALTPKAILFRPSRTRRHGAYVPQLRIPRHAIPEKFPPGHHHPVGMALDAEHPSGTGLRGIEP